MRNKNRTVFTIPQLKSFFSAVVVVAVAVCQKILETLFLFWHDRTHVRGVTLVVETGG